MKKRRRFERTKLNSKADWRKRAKEAFAGLRPQDQEALRLKLGYPLRIKDFNERMCKKVIRLAGELDNETNRNLKNRREHSSQ